MLDIDYTTSQLPQMKNSSFSCFKIIWKNTRYFPFC